VYRLDSYELVRRSVTVGGMSKRAPAREYGVNRRSIDKMVVNASPPGYVLTSPRRKWVLGDFMEKIEEVVLRDQLSVDDHRHECANMRLQFELRADSAFASGNLDATNLATDMAAGMSIVSKALSASLLETYNIEMTLVVINGMGSG